MLLGVITVVTRETMPFFFNFINIIAAGHNILFSSILSSIISLLYPEYKFITPHKMFVYSPLLQSLRIPWVAVLINKRMHPDRHAEPKPLDILNQLLQIRKFPFINS